MRLIFRHIVPFFLITWYEMISILCYCVRTTQYNTLTQKCGMNLVAERLKMHENKSFSKRFCFSDAYEYLKLQLR